MAKYIDTEKLIAYLNKKMQSYKSKMVDPRKYPIDHIDLMAFLAREYQAIIANVISLQQDKETLELCSKIWWEEQGWIMIPPDATVEGIESLLKQVRKKLQQEQPEVDLKKGLADYCHRYYNYDYPKQAEKGTGSPVMPHIIEAAKYFYELGRNSK